MILLSKGDITTTSPRKEATPGAEKNLKLKRSGGKFMLESYMDNYGLTQSDEVVIVLTPKGSRIPQVWKDMPKKLVDYNLTCWRELQGTRRGRTRVAGSAAPGCTGSTAGRTCAGPSSVAFEQQQVQGTTIDWVRCDRPEYQPGC